MAGTLRELIEKFKSRVPMQLHEKRRLVHSIWDEVGVGVPEDQKVPIIARVLELSLEETKKFLHDAEQPVFTGKEDSAAEKADLIIIDEVSMVGKDLGQRLMAFGKPILVVGDPAQLQPVADHGEDVGFFTDADPDVMLTEIKRQKKDDPIIRMATQAREWGYLEYDDYGTSRLIGSRRFENKTLLETDQVLVWKNSKRFELNATIRELLGRKSTMPEKGDKLCCLVNNADHGFYNGTLWIVESIMKYHEDKQLIEAMLIPEEKGAGTAEEVRSRFAVVDARVFMPGNGEITEKKYANFTYGYAVTVHKSQGSEWKRVLVIDDCGLKQQARKPWLYTAVTRAKEQIIVVVY